MKNLDEVIKSTIGISKDADNLTLMDKGECKLVAEEWATEVVKNLTLHDVRLSLIAYEEAKHSFLPPKYRKETATNIVNHVLGNL
jgi:hypothetical protein